MQHNHNYNCNQKDNPVNQVNHMLISDSMTAGQLVAQMEVSGVMGAGRIAKASRIMQEMFEDKNCTVFLGLAGAMVPGGMKKVIIDLLRSGKIKVFVTTGANLTHDMVEALGYHHQKGTDNVDDKELNRQKIDRIFDSFMPNEVYEGLEDFFAKHFDALSKTTNIKEFLWLLGSMLECKPEESILKTCAEKKIPIFCPAIADSGIGLMIWGNLAKGKKANILVFDDLKEMLDLAWESEKAGVIYIGGGVPKNYIQQAMQLSPKAAEYGIQITTDRPEPGGSSGAPLKEGISWGKMNAEGKFVDVICDATIAFPLIYAAVKERLSKK